MSIYPLLENNHPLLKIPLEEYSEEAYDFVLGEASSNSEFKSQLLENLVETMRHYNGIGLSANQCGIMQRVFVMYSNVKRPSGIHAIFEDVEGTKQEYEMFGLESRVFQHEMDHMEGTDFTKKVSKLRLDRAKKRVKKQQKKLDRSNSS